MSLKEYLRMCNVLGLDNKKPCEMKQEWTQFRKKLEKKKHEINQEKDNVTQRNGYKHINSYDKMFIHYVTNLSVISQADCMPL